MWTSIETNSRVLICNTREATCLEWDTCSAWFIFIFIPDFLSQISWKSWISSFLKESFQIVETFRGFVNLKVINFFWSFWLFWSFRFLWCLWFWSFYFFLLNRCFWFSSSHWFRLGCSFWFSWSCLGWSGNWCWLFHWRGLRFKSSTLNFLFCTYSCSLKFGKVSCTIINFCGHSCTFSSNFLWMRPAARKTFGKNKL